jgi:hypothetical protein
MAKKQKAAFLRKFLLLEAKKRNLLEVLRDRSHRLLADEPNDRKYHTRQFRAFLKAAREILGENLVLEAQEKWQKVIINRQKARVNGRLWALTRRMTLSEEAVVRQIEIERARDAQLKVTEEAARRLRVLDAREQRAKVNLARSRAQRVEAKAKAAEARTIYYQEQKKRMEQEQKRQAEVADEKLDAALSCGFDASKKDDGVDILRDTQWVYKNIAQLILISDNGVRKLNPQLMAEAPSNGARAVAMYAMEDHGKFMERYAIKLFPKEIKTDAETARKAAERQAQLDPSFDELAKYFEKE